MALVGQIRNLVIRGMVLCAFLSPAAPMARADATAPADDLESCIAPRSTVAIDLAQVQASIGKRKATVVYPEIPSVYARHLPAQKPQAIIPNWQLSPGLGDPLIEEARRLSVYEDFKPLSDARVKALSARELAANLARAGQDAERASSRRGACRKAFLRSYIDHMYTFGSELIPVRGLIAPKRKLKSGDPKIDEAFDYTERTLAMLIRRTPPRSEGSLLPNPYPFAIPAGRFQESYYWDSYFGMLGMLATGRLELAQMQVENFLESVRDYGFVPNGMRDYYLSRSQPPFLSSMIHDVYESTARARSSPEELRRLQSWLKSRAYPLMERDYEGFWMNPDTRYDAVAGLNHDWDDLNLPRPERPALDDETKLGKTFRDVRAEAESGLDFTQAFEGEGTHVAGVLLNGMLFKTETDLAWAAREVGDTAASRKFEAAARKRKAAMDRYLWDPEKGDYENYNLRTGRRIPVLSAVTFVPLFVGAASPEQAAAVRKTLAVLEKKGGIMSSELSGSTDQWDGKNGWAPLQIMAVQGLRNYGFDDDARRLARKWVDLVADVEHRMGAMYERMDVVGGAQAMADKTKYPPQVGFLWTNSSFVWMLKDVLGYPLLPIH